MNTMKKYICLNTQNLAQNGLNDMKDRFTEYLKLSKILSLTPILPKIKLSDNHTSKKDNYLTDYIDIPDFVIQYHPIDENEIFYWNLTSDFIPNDDLYKKYAGQIHDYVLNIIFLDKYKKIAEEIIDSLKKPICIVHVRRGDYLSIINSLNYTTKPEHISDVLRKYNFNNCYIKTNEFDPNFFDSLKIEFNVKLFCDFPILQKIADSGDNYALYCVECCMRDLCDIRISTFNTKNKELCWLPNNDPDYFTDYLDETHGFQ